jgi:hypothetical protein
MDEIVENDEFTKCLNSIGEQVEDEHSEREIELMFLNQGFFQILGYEDVGNTLRSEYTLPEGGKVDFVTSGESDQIRDSQTVIYEFKAPDRRLNRHKEQLFGYMDEIHAEYGVLTNGRHLSLYSKSPTGPKLEDICPVELESATETEASVLIIPLGYLSIEERNIRSVAEYAAEEVVETIPPSLHLDYSEPQREVFANHFSEYLGEKYQEKRN